MEGSITKTALVLSLAALLLSGCGGWLRSGNVASAAVSDAVSAEAERYFQEAQAAAGRGDSEAAIAGFKQAIALNATPAYYYQMGVTYHGKAMAEEARAAYLKTIESAPEPKMHTPQLTHAYYNLACLTAVAGQTDEAFDWLAKAVDSFFPDLELFQKDPDLDSLRKDFRYEMMRVILMGKLGQGQEEAAPASDAAPQTLPAQIP